MPSIMAHMTVGGIRAINYIYELLAWPFHYMFKEDRRMPAIASASVRENQADSPWRNLRSMDKLSDTMYSGLSTLDDLWCRSVRLYGDQPCQGTREHLAVSFETQPNGKQFKKCSLGDYHWQTYSEVDDRISRLGAGLLALGLKPHKDRVVIYAETRAEWMITAQACFRYSIPIVTLYSTLGDDAVVHGLKEAEVTFIITSDELLPKLALILPRVEAVRHVVFMSNGIFGGCSNTTEFLATMPTIPKHVQVSDILGVERLGNRQENKISEEDRKKKYAPTKDELALIMYTSGSTGLPKGVIITHENLMSATAGMYECLPTVNPTDIYIGYLPLAHVLELACELVLLSNGIRVGYSGPQTLTDQGTKLAKGCRGDVIKLGPTLMTCVPTILDRLSKAVWEKVNEGGAMSNALFKWSYQHKLMRMTKGYRTPFLDNIVFGKVRGILGGNIRYMLSGGAPLSSEAQEFVNVCFSKIIQGYGLTETCGCGTLYTPGDLRGSHVGPPLTNLEIKLREWTEGGYSPKDLPHSRGEVLIGGKCVSLGYHNQPEKTAEDFFVDKEGTRWFCTGDIGMFTEDGRLAIIDRKKDLVKLQAGEYVSLGKVELALSSCPIVETICVYGDSLQHSPVCLMVPKKKQLAQLAEKIGLPKEAIADHDSLCKNTKICKEVLTELQRVCKSKGLQSYEIPVCVYLDPHPWTPDTGFITDAFKLKRRAIQDHFQLAINQMYDSLMTGDIRLDR